MGFTNSNTGIPILGYKKGSNTGILIPGYKYIDTDTGIFILGYKYWDTNTKYLILVALLLDCPMPQAVVSVL